MLHHIDPTESYEPSATVRWSSFNNSPVQLFLWPGAEMVYGDTLSTTVMSVIAGRTTPRRLRLSYGFSNSTTYWLSFKIPLLNEVTTKLVVGFLFENKNETSPSDAGTALKAGGILKIGAPLSAGGTTKYNDALYLETNGALTLNGQTSAAGIVVFGQQTFIEVVYDFVAGTFEVFADDVSVLAGTTTLTSASSFNFLVQGTETSGVAELMNMYDNVYALDDQGTTNNARLGPVLVANCPLSASVDTNFTPQGGAVSNLAAVQKTDLSTTTYNQSTSANDVGDSFTIDTSGIPSGSDILGVRLQSFMTKTQTTPRSAAVTIDDGANQVEKAVVVTADRYTGNTPALYETAPDGTGWDLTKLAATNFGYEAKA